jgi:hypothetical protein
MPRVMSTVMTSGLLTALDRRVAANISSAGLW